MMCHSNNPLYQNGWIVWKYAIRDGEIAAIPYSLETNVPINSNDESAWGFGSYEGALQAMLASCGFYDGLMYVNTPVDVFNLHDIDPLRGLR